MTQSEEKKACSVSQAMGIAKRGLEQIRLTVVGEVSEFNDKQGYKAAYFTIRDEGSSMPCQMWRDAYEKCGVQLRAGLLVEVTGYFSCYPVRGTMQFTVRSMKLAGEGNLRVKVAQLAAKLQAEGLMDPSRKLRIPALPKRIAVVTSPRGKAIRDVMRTLRRRYPMGELMVFGVNVEGDRAHLYMQQALEAAQRAVPAPEIILLVRGGGAYETMMPFNEESLARAISACTIPIITGIGHEPDNTIADMVADRRCSTPTAAAEAVAPSTEELYRKVENATKALDQAYANRINALYHRLGRLSDRPVWQDPQYLTGGHEVTLSMQAERLAKALPRSLEQSQSQLRELGIRLQAGIPGMLQSDARKLETAQQQLDSCAVALLKEAAASLKEGEAALKRSGASFVNAKGQALGLAAAKLDALSPLKTLSRGYAITYAQDGRSVIDSVSKVETGDQVKIRVSDGMLECSVDAIEGNDAHE